MTTVSSNSVIYISHWATLATNHSVAHA